jgi:hypothetical protein
MNSQEKRSVHRSIKIKPSLYALLEKAAAASGRSINREIEVRLLITFYDEQKGAKVTPFLP